MSIQPATTPIPAPAKRRRRWLRGVLALLALVILVPVGFYGYLRYTTALAWDAAEAEADRLDPDWRMTPLLLKRRAVPDEENSGLLIIATAGKAPGFQAAALCDAAFPEGLPPNAKLNARQVQLLRGELGKIRGPLSEARQLKDYPYGRFPVKIGPLFFATLLPDHQKAHDICRWLKQDAYELAHDGAIDVAVDSCRANLCAARSMGDEPFIISHLIRVTIQWEAILALERALGQGEASEAALKKMQALLELEIRESTWLHALGGERAGCDVMFNDIRTGKLSAKALLGLRPAGKSFGLSDWFMEKFPSTYLNDYPEHLDHLTRVIEIAKLPLHEQRPKIREWDEANRTSRNRVARLFAYSVENTLKAECRSQALLRCAMTAMACERYRLEHQAWPNSLDVLVEQKLLNAVPLDPIDGKPLRYRKDGDMIVIYSIGNDEKDDGGFIDRARPEEPGVDVGFRLWSKEQRGVAPLPPVKLD